MNTQLEIGVSGIGAFLPGVPDWTHLREVLRGQRDLDAYAPAKPSGGILPAAERRRAPDGVRLAAEVAQQACAMAGYSPDALPCVFASTHGELAITDYVCETLARAPDELSPTKFHNSVLNAPAGYWTIATGCTAASSAVSAYHASFAAGLMEAAVLACSEATPALFACCDVASTGPVASMTRTTLAFGVALVLTPKPVGTRLRIKLRAGATNNAPASPVLALRAASDDNPANAQALSLLAMLAQTGAAGTSLALSSGLSMDLEIAA